MLKSSRDTAAGGRSGCASVPAGHGLGRGPRREDRRQRADLTVKFRLGEQEHTLVLEVSALGQPRQIREAVTRLEEIRREVPGAYPVAAAVYIGPQSARDPQDARPRLSRSLRQLLPGLRERPDREGRQAQRPAVHPAAEVPVRAPGHAGWSASCWRPERAWRLEELAKAAEVSLGHAHNVVKRLEELPGWSATSSSASSLASPPTCWRLGRGVLLPATTRSARTSSPERVTRKLMGDIARVAERRAGATPSPCTSGAVAGRA